MTSKLPRNAMSLKQFMVHQEVLKLYRGFIRSIRTVDNETDRKQLLEWVRSDFRKHKNETDEITIKTLMMNGQKMLKELQQSLALSRS